MAGPPPAAILDLAHRHMQAGRPSDAANTISALTSMPGASVEALVLHVQALVAAGRQDEALIASRKAAAAGVPHAELGSAQIAADLGRFAEAEAGFRKALAGDPGDERARRGLARALYAGPAGIEGALAAADQGLAYRWTATLALFKTSLLNQADRHDEALALARDGLAREAYSPALHGAAATAAARPVYPRMLWPTPRPRCASRRRKTASPSCWRRPALGWAMARARCRFSSPCAARRPSTKNASPWSSRRCA